MRLRWLLIAILCLVYYKSALADERYTPGQCWQGNTTLTVPGLAVLPQKVVGTWSTCTVTVYATGTTNLATIFADNLVPPTAVANPFTCPGASVCEATGSGRFYFYAAAGRYDIRVAPTGNGAPAPFTLGDVLLCDPLGPNSDTACSGSGGGLTPHNLLSVTHPDTTPFTPPNRGDIITGQFASPNTKWTRLGVGTANQLVSTDATDVLWANFNFYQNSTTPVNAASRLGLNLIAGTNITSITATDDPTNNRVSYTINASSQAVTIHSTCMIIIGADNGSALGNADIAPQGKQCFIPAASTVVEVTVAADAGTPSVLPDKITASGTKTDLLSGALSTAASGGVACSNAGGTLGIDGITTCTNTLTTTALAAGVWLETDTGVAGGTAKRISIAISFTTP